MRSPLLLLSAALMVLSGCSLFDFRNDKTLSVASGEAFELREGEGVAIGHEAVRFEYVQKTDESRCPADVRCFSEGSVSTAVRLTIGRRTPVAFTLTGFVYGDTRSVLRTRPIQDTLGYRIELLAVAPYPISTQPDVQHSVATFRVSVLEEAPPSGSFVLNEGESISFDSGNGRFQFLDTPSDSRCPIDVDCIWAGEVSTLLEVQFGQAELFRFTLTGHVPGEITGLDQEIATLDTLGYRFEMLAVSPYPDTRVQHPPSTVGTFLIHKTVSD